jgi:hypothetical protein
MSDAVTTGDQRMAAKRPAKAVKATKAKPSADEGKTRYLQTRINDDGWHALKMLSVEERRTLQAIFVEALNDLLRKYRKAAVVEGPSQAE